MVPCTPVRTLGTDLPNQLAVVEPHRVGGVRRSLVTQPCSVEMSGATAGLSSSAGNTVGQANRGTRVRRSLVLLGLLLLCLAPRALMAWKLGGVCPDGVAYIHLAGLLDQGNPGEFLRLSGLNPLPVVLVLLHREGSTGSWPGACGAC